MLMVIVFIEKFDFFILTLFYLFTQTKIEFLLFLLCFFIFKEVINLYWKFEEKEYFYWDYD